MQQTSHNIPFIVLISCVATIGGFLFGFDSGVINGTVDGLQLAFQSDSVGTGFSVASMLLGCAIGALIAGRLSDSLGRVRVLQIAAVLFIISAYGSGIAASQTSFVIFRIIGGLAVGAASILAPAYISEIAPANIRGRLISIQQIAIIVGLFSAFISNYLLASFAGSSIEPLWLGFEAWRWMFWMELIPAALFLITLMFIPESPRYLVIADKMERAGKVLEKLFGNENKTEQLRDIEASVAEDKKNHLGFSGLLAVSSGLKPVVWIGIGLAVFQQLVGINVVFYYGAVLWQAVGFAESDALLINIISGGLSILACLITLVLIDKIGRKPFLMLGSIGMSICLSIMAFTFASASLDTTGNLDLGSFGTVTLTAANAYVFFFNMSWGPVMWVMLGEMFPNSIRGVALSIAGLAQWGSNFIVTLTFPILLAGFGLAFAYGLYALCAVVSIAFVYKFIKETKGLDLESME